MIRKVTDNTNSDTPNFRVFSMYVGEGLSYLFVPFSDLEAAKLHPYNFSELCLIDQDGIYLEGDLDAQIFIDNYPIHTGFRVLINEVDQELMPSTVIDKNKVSIAQKYWDNRKKKSFKIVK